MKITIQQIAEMCNVSRGTVDRVLHNRPNVHPQIRQTVLTAIEQAGYRPPSQLQNPVPKIAGLVLPGWPDPYFTEHTQLGVSAALSKIEPSRFSIITSPLSGRSAEEHSEAIDLLLAQGVDGLILNAPMDLGIVDRLNAASRQGVKIITLFDELPQCPSAYYVGQDVIRCGRVAAGLMAKYLRPSERVLAISGDLNFHSHKERVRSFVQRLSVLTGSDNNVEVLYCHELFEATAQSVHQHLLLDDRIRYIYMATQSLPGCIEGIRRAQLPYRITVICTDTTAAARAFLDSGDVDFVVGQSIAQTAAQAVEMIYRLVCLGIEPRDRQLFSELAIYTKQMLYKEDYIR